MIDYVLDTLQTAGLERVLVVVGYQADLVRATLGGRPNLEFVLQAEQRGTGHAVLMCREALAAHNGPVVVVAGDSPMLRAESLQKLLAKFRAERPACLLGTAYKEDPAGLGRIVRDADGRFQGIVEEKDATPAQRAIREVNLSCYVFSRPDLFAALEHVRPANSQGEYYLTDCPGWLLAQGRNVLASPDLQPSETLSINNPQELAAVEDALRHEQRFESV